TNGKEGDALLRRHEIVCRLEVVAVSAGRWIARVIKLRGGECPPAIIVGIADLVSRTRWRSPDELVRRRKMRDQIVVEGDPRIVGRVGSGNPFLRGGNDDRALRDCWAALRVFTNLVAKDADTRAAVGSRNSGEASIARPDRLLVVIASREQEISFFAGRTCQGVEIVGTAVSMRGRPGVTVDLYAVHPFARDEVDHPTDRIGTVHG